MSSSYDSLFLKYQLEESKPKISSNSKLLFIGSCFADNVGSHLKNHHFNVAVNPFGIAFNPYSLFKQTQITQQTLADPNSNILCHENIFYHYDFHSSVYGESSQGLIENINDRLSNFRSSAKHLDWVFITLGTSWIYETIDEKSIVCNCHKQDSSLFNKRLLTVEEIIDALKGLTAFFRSKSPDVTIVFTVSPVRHTKDGLWENNVSKGLLHSAIFEIVDIDQQLQYFPSYEIIIDVLRDYRFFKTDQLHPNQVAVDYIIEHLKTTYFDDHAKRFYHDMNSYRTLSNHIPKTPLSEAKDKHQRLLQHKWLELKKLYPHLS